MHMYNTAANDLQHNFRAPRGMMAQRTTTHLAHMRVRACAGWTKCMRWCPAWPHEITMLACFFCCCVGSVFADTTYWRDFGVCLCVPSSRAFCVSRHLGRIVRDRRVCISRAAAARASRAHTHTHTRAAAAVVWPCLPKAVTAASQKWNP